MSGVGPVELIVIIFVVVALFGPTLIAFWLGFTLGRKSTAEKDQPSAARPTTPAPPESPKPPASAEEPTHE